MKSRDLKKWIKQNVPLAQKVANMKNNMHCRRRVIQNINDYKKKYLCFSTSEPDIDHILFNRRVIIINSHILEKGLSHSDFRPGFGKQVVIDLQNNLKKYLEKGGDDSFAIKNAVSLLSIYHDINELNGYDDSSYLDLNRFSEIETEDIEPYEYQIGRESSIYCFSDFAKKRHSVRVYTDESLDVSKELLSEVISIANTAPSACNRQATHVFAVSDKELLRKIEEIHGGCKEFGRRSSAFLFITSDLSLYSSNETKLPIYDAGIYTMNLLYSLQELNLYSCTLNGSFPGNANNVVHDIVGIPKNYEICGLIAIYRLKPNSNIKIAFSPKREAKDVITFTGWKEA